MRLAAIVLLGFALRLLRLAHLGDLEFDEIVSVDYASLPPPALLRELSGALFEHPPAFYLALGAWRAVTGESEASARLFSVFPGTLTIPLAWAAGRRLLGARAALLGALLVAVAPLTLFYSREARMYGWLTCLCLAALWLFLRGASAPRQRASWGAYGVAGALAAYTHYLGALLILTLLGVALALRRARPGILAPAALVTGGIFLLALPWAVAARGARASVPAMALGHLRDAPAQVWAIWVQVAAGPDAAGPLAALAAVGLAALAAAGFPRAPASRAAVAGALAAALVGLLMTVVFDKPLQPRYLLPATPLLYVCAAGALRRLAAGAAVQRALAAGGAVLLLAGFAPFWARYYVTYRRADYSDVTQRIRALEQPEDYVLLTGPWQARYFDHYYAGSLFHTVLPRDAPPALDPAEARPRLEAIAATHRRLWFVQAGLSQADPTNFVEGWLLRHAWPVFREAHSNAVLWLFATEPPARTRALQPATFGESLRLTGGWADGDDVEAGGALRLTLDFALTAPVATSYKASLRVVGLDGQRTALDFDLVDLAADAGVPVSGWTPGTTVSLRRAVWIPETFSPQPYEVRLVVYDPATLAPLPPHAAGGADLGAAACERAGCAATVGAVYVTQPLGQRRPAQGAGYVAAPRRPHDAESIELAGLRWHQADPSVGPLDFDLVWYANRVTLGERRSTVDLVATGGRIWLQDPQPMFRGTFNVHDWRDGTPLEERRGADLTALPPGEYHLMVGLQDGQGNALSLNGFPGSVEVARFDLPYRAPLAARLQRRLQTLQLPRLLGLQW